MDASLIVIMVICMVLLAGEFLFSWLSDRLGPHDGSPLWKQIAFYAVLPALVVGVAALLGPRNQP